MAKSAGKAIGKGAWKATKYTGKKIGRGAIRTLAAAPGALLGGAMAIATGNTSYLAAGAGIGYALGGKAADALGKAPGAIRTSYRQERLGVQGAAGKARYEEFKKNEDNINYFKEEYGVSSKQAKAMIEQGKEFIEAGYTNPEDVSRLMQMQEASGGASADQIMAADQMASQLKIDDFLDSKKSAQLESNLTNQMKSTAKASGRQITDGKAKELAHNHMNSMRVAKGLAPVVASSSQKVPVKKVETPNVTKQKTKKSNSTTRTSSAPRNTSSARTSSTRTSGSRTSSRTSSTRASESKTSSNGNKRIKNGK